MLFPTEISRQRVAGNKLTFVLTLAPTGTGRDDQDLQRVHLQWQTFDRFFDKSFLDRYIVVVPDETETEVREAIRPISRTAKMEILNENDVCPEFRSDPDTTNNWPKPNKGWFRQQLIKLAIHEYVRTPFYMTLDADVLFVREFDTDSLIRNGKAIVNVQNERVFRDLYCHETADKEVRVRQTRYREAERILLCERRTEYRDRWYGETPVLLNCELARSLTNHIQRIWEKPWRQALLDNLPWTEYPLYFVHVEDQAKLEQYYLQGGADSVLRLTESLWQPADEYRTPRDLSSWDPAMVFDNDGEGVAVVVQSYLGYPVADLAKKIRPYVT